MQEIIQIDCRQMEHPEPMLAVLGACSKLQPGQQVQMLHRITPHPLFPKLNERGLDYRIEEREGHIEVWIFHKK